MLKRVKIQGSKFLAKNPQLKMKLENMPISLTAEMIDAYMSVLGEYTYYLTDF